MAFAPKRSSAKIYGQSARVLAEECPIRTRTWSTWVRFKVRHAEVRLDEVRIDVGVLVAPLVPDGHALLEYRYVLVVSHRVIQG
jgi:hypothetical protein